MRKRHAVTLIVALSLPVFATEPEAPAPPPPARDAERKVENQPQPVAQPKLEPKKKGARFVQRRLARPFAGEGTPLVVSQTGALKTVRPADRTFEFEPGAPVRSLWPDADTAWLVRDLDGDGAIRSGRELFGSWTVTASTRPENGFAALAELDEDGDGFVTARDAHFGELRLWFDRDGDRSSNPSELVTLASGTRLPVRFARELRCLDRARAACTDERAQFDDGRWLLDLHLKLEASPTLVGAGVAARFGSASQQREARE